jgi:hypothetical protein
MVGLMWLTACSGEEKPRREVISDGVVCARLLGSGAVEVEVRFRECLTSCDIAQPASCVVTKESLDGSESLRVESRAVIESTGASVCSSTCGELRAACSSTDTFAPGSYVVSHGANEATLVLGARRQCLFSE